jgi:hypothetical protein
MTNLIRKISYGPDYKDSMKHQIGSMVLRGTLEVVDIRDIGNETYEVYVRNDKNESFMWKKISGMPVVIEFNVDF